MTIETNPNLSSLDPAEVEKFSKMAAEWWNPKGKFGVLHKFNPVRLGYIRDRAAAHWQRDPLAGSPLNGLSLLDIGCGWGGFAEHAGLQGIKVHGITISKAQLEIAQERIQRHQLHS